MPGELGPLARLDGTLRDAMAEGSIRHVKLWTEEGLVIWSDEEAVTGRRFELEDNVRDLFGTGGITAEVSSLDKAENVAERGEGELLEVYAGVADGAGEPLVVEAYLSTAQMRAQQRTILVALLTLAVGVLVAYQLAVVPLAVGLARRVERGQEQNAAVLRRSLLAIHRERLRIAHDLHDGVVQDLAGLAYAMPLVADQLPSTPEASLARQTVADATVMLAHDVEALRSLLVDIHPPDLEGRGLTAAAATWPRGWSRPAPPSSWTCPRRRTGRSGPRGWSTARSRRVCATSSLPLGRLPRRRLGAAWAPRSASRSATTDAASTRRPNRGAGTSGCSCCARTSRTSAGG